MERDELGTFDRFGTNCSTEIYQPHYGQGIKDQPLQHYGTAGPLSTISRGPTGVGAHFSMCEPAMTGDGYHEVHGAQPILARAAGA
jgi:uncharacterized protein YcgI (DUF1989 family)